MAKKVAMICQEAAAGKVKTIARYRVLYKDHLVDAVVLAIYTASTLGKPCVHPLPSEDQRA